MTTRKIENNTDRMIHLPPLYGIECDPEALRELTGAVPSEDEELIDFPNGIKLLPAGLTTVPELYYQALRDHTVNVYDQLGFPRKSRKGGDLKRYPGRELLNQLQQVVEHYRASGKVVSPLITVYEPGQANDREDGPAAPPSLPAKLEAAQAIVAVVTDRKALERYMKATKDSALKLAIQSRLSSLGAK